MLQQHSLLSRLFPAILPVHTVACGNLRFCNLLAHSRPLAVFAFVIASHTVALRSFHFSQSSYTWLPLAAFTLHCLPVQGCFSSTRSSPAFFQSSCTQLLMATFAFATFLHNSCPLAVFAFAIASHTVAPVSFRFSQSSFLHTVAPDSV